MTSAVCSVPNFMRFKTIINKGTFFTHYTKQYTLHTHTHIPYSIHYDGASAVEKFRHRLARHHHDHVYDVRHTIPLIVVSLGKSPVLSHSSSTIIGLSMFIRMLSSGWNVVCFVTFIAHHFNKMGIIVNELKLF